jgi:hypothetical protein
MGIRFENGAEDKPLTELTMGDLCKLIEYVIDRTHHNQMALTDAVGRAECTLETLTAKRARTRNRAGVKLWSVPKAGEQGQIRSHLAAGVPSLASARFSGRQRALR